VKKDSCHALFFLSRPGSASWPSVCDTPGLLCAQVFLMGEGTVNPRPLHRFLLQDIPDKPEKMKKGGAWIPVVTGQRSGLWKLQSTTSETPREVAS
jgi:hypothetical protein